MFLAYNTDTVKPMIELRAGDKVKCLGDIYTVTAYSVPTPKTVKVWLEPVLTTAGVLPHNPVMTVSMHHETLVPLA